MRTFPSSIKWNGWKWRATNGIRKCRNRWNLISSLTGEKDPQAAKPADAPLITRTAFWETFMLNVMLVAIVVIMYGPASFPVKVMHLFMNMDKMVGKDLKPAWRT